MSWWLIHRIHVVSVGVISRKPKAQSMQMRYWLSGLDTPCIFIKFHSYSNIPWMAGPWLNIWNSFRFPYTYKMSFSWNELSSKLQWTTILWVKRLPHHTPRVQTTDGLIPDSIFSFIEICVLSSISALSCHCSLSSFMPQSSITKLHVAPTMRETPTRMLRLTVRYFYQPIHEN